MASNWTRDNAGKISIPNVTGRVALDVAPTQEMTFGLWVVIADSVTYAGSRDFCLVTVSIDSQFLIQAVKQNKFSHLSFGRGVNVHFEATNEDNQLHLYGTTTELVNYTIHRFWSNLSYQDDYSPDTTYTGDVTGYGSGSIALTLSPSGVTPGTYNSVTVDSKGRVIAGTNTSTGSRIFQVVTGTINTYSGTTIISGNNTPTITDGTQIWSQAIAITGGTKVKIESQLTADSQAGGRVLNIAFFRNSVFIGYSVLDLTTSGKMSQTNSMIVDTGLTAGNYTYSCRIGISGSGTWFLGSDVNGNKFGGTVKNCYALTELS